MKTLTLMFPPEATAAINSRVSCLPVESLPLMQCIGATLREDIVAERDVPAFDRVCMDGIAIDSTTAARGVRQFNIQATQAAGVAALRLARDAAVEGAIEVMTGAIMPVYTDCVVPIEHYTNSNGLVQLSPSAVTTRYRNVQRRGSDGLAGSVVLTSGCSLGANEIAVAASAGMARLGVSAQPALMVISTGDELIEPGEPIAEHQVRRSNAYAVIAALRARGFRRVGDDHLRDDETMLRERLLLHLTTHDVLILSGGVSMGKFDLVPKVLTQIGVQEIFHNVAQRPGKPMWFGIGPQGQAVFGLPGNPVSTLVCLIRYVIPAIAAAMGARITRPERVALASQVTFDLPLAYFLPVKIKNDASGHCWATPRATNSSGDFLSLAGTDGFIELPPGPATFAKGFTVPLYRW